MGKKPTSRVESFVYRSRLCHAMSVLVTQCDKSVQRRRRAAVQWHQILSHGDLDRKQEARSLILVRNWWTVCFYDFGKLVRLNLIIHVVEQLPCSIDVIQLDARRRLEVERLNLLLALGQLLCLFEPRGRLLRLKVVCWPREHFCHEKLLDTSAVLFDSLADRLYTKHIISQKSLSML